MSSENAKRRLTLNRSNGEKREIFNSLVSSDLEKVAGTGTEARFEKVLAESVTSIRSALH